MRGQALCWIGLVLLGAGCKPNQARPLDAKAQASAWATPDPERIRVRVEALKHPLLKPRSVDFRQGVSPEDADVLAVVANPDLRAARAQRDLAAAQLLDAGLLPDPVLSYGQDVPVGGSDQGAAKASSTQVALDLGSLLTRGLRRSAARAEQQSMGARSHREGGRHPERHPAAAL